jgi:hypothetical protein
MTNKEYLVITNKTNKHYTIKQIEWKQLAYGILNMQEA